MGRCPWGSIGATGRWCSRWCRAATGVQVAETDPHVRARADLLVQGEFRTLVPGQRVAQEPGRVPHLADDGLLDLACVVPVGQVRCM